MLNRSKAPFQLNLGDSMCIATLFFLSFFVDILALLKNVPRRSP